MEYFDFYLFHNVCEMNIDSYLDEKYGIFDYLVRQKKAGRIRHLGFSAHGEYNVIKRFLEAYGSEMEFGQLQVNYLDWDFQNARKKVELLKEYRLPVWVMEPLRGGKLASLAEADEKKLQELRPDETIPAWAFRFLQSIPEVTVVLSGMSSLPQLKENIETFGTDKPLNETEMETLLSIADGMVKKIALPCTACHYCVSHCPQELDIQGSSPSIMSTASRKADSSHRWPCPLILRKSCPAPASDAEAARRSVPRGLISRRRWRILRRG